MALQILRMISCSRFGDRGGDTEEQCLYSQGARRLVKATKGNFAGEPPGAKALQGNRSEGSDMTSLLLAMPGQAVEQEPRSLIKGSRTSSNPGQMGHQDMRFEGKLVAALSCARQTSLVWESV